jgi:hypothetical protein
MRKMNESKNEMKSPRAEQGERTVLLQWRYSAVTVL